MRSERRGVGRISVLDRVHRAPLAEGIAATVG
jgi:hypothetical protein